MSALGGSRASVYSHASTVRTLRGTTKGNRNGPSHKLPWWKRPLVSSAFYTDLQRGSWHIGFYTFFLSIWTMFTSGFDLYCLHEATPGTNHTGYYIISFDFVYVGNPHVRDLLIMSGAFSLIGGLCLLITCVMLLDALRKEQEMAFKGWLWVMVFFTPWKIVAWTYAAIVNDMIFAYNIIMFIAWLIFNVLNVLSFICIWSLYLELNDLTKIQDLARLKTGSVTSGTPSTGYGYTTTTAATTPQSSTAQQPSVILNPKEAAKSYQMDTMNSLPASRAASAYGSRPTSPYVNRDTLRSNLNAYNQQLHLQGQQQQHHPQQQQPYKPHDTSYDYGQIV